MIARVRVLSFVACRALRDFDSSSNCFLVLHFHVGNLIELVTGDSFFLALGCLYSLDYCCHSGARWSCKTILKS
jgi:hypothetical protein